MRSPLRIAILVCGELFGEAKKEYGSCGNLYKVFLEQSVSKLNKGGRREPVNLQVSFYDVVNKQEYPDLDDIDAVFISGSHHDSFTPGLNNWITKLVKFITSLLKNQSRVRIMAVCFGHQIVGRAYGVMPQRNDAGWEVAVVPMTLTERGKQIFGQDSLALHQMHRDVVPRYPPSVENLAHSDRCGVQGLYVKNKVISLQGHPEFESRITDGMLERRRGGLFDEPTYWDGKKRVNNPHDGLTVGVSFLKFLLET